MQQFWDERYTGDEYVYGTEPNAFLVKELQELKQGKILFPAEGEGRNSVYAATLGWNVTAFDFSEEAQRKALRLANKNKVKIDYRIANFDDVNFPEEYFDCIALIYVHHPSEKRNEYHRKILSYLKPGGQMILEAFSKEQINNDTGGPGNIDFLYSKKEIEDDFRDLSIYDISCEDIILSEGIYHNGKASVVRLSGTK